MLTASRAVTAQISQSGKIRVAHLSTVHSAFDIRIYHKECATLARAGYEVVLIIPHEQDEMSNGVRTCAVPKPASRTQRMSRTVFHVFRAALREHANLYHFHDPELIPVGVLLKLSGKCVIYDAHENVPQDILTKDYVPRALRGLVAWAAGFVEFLGSSCFDGIVAATPAIARRFPPNKTVPVQNFPILDELVCDRPLPFAKRPPQLAYVGGMTKIRGIKEMVRAMALLPETLGARLVMAGDCDPALYSEIQAMEGMRRLEFWGWRSRPEVRALLSQSRSGLVLYHPCSAHAEAQPNKLFEYMSAGLPVIASNFPLWRRIIDEARCGIVVDPLNPSAIAKAMEWLLEHPEEAQTMGKKGLEAVRAKYSWGREAEQLTAFYRELLEKDVR